MKLAFLLCGLLIAQPVAAAQPAATVAESKQPHSSVSVLVDPQLNDGRLVVKIAAKNLTASSVPFGPAGVSIARPSGEAIALYPLQSLINDVRLAAGMSVEGPTATAPTQGAYASPQMSVRDGRVDPTGFTGGSVVGRDEYIRRNQTRRRKATISQADAQAQIAALNQAILQDSVLAPGQIVVGQVVSEKLKFKKGEERTLHLRIRIAGDEHAFTIAAPTG